MVDDPNRASQQLIESALKVAEAANRSGAACALIGGLAVSYRTFPRFTRDVDFLLEVPALALPRLLQDLTEQGFLLDEEVSIREWTQQHMTTISYEGVRVDWLKPVLPSFQHILQTATPETWNQRNIRVASPEGLLLLKLLAYRLQDQIDIENLVAAHRGRLNLDWIRSEWQSFADLSDPRMQRLMELIARRDA